MPDAGEPIPGAPTNYWAGQYDAQQFADALGMSWIAPLFATTIPRVVNIPALCAAPKPAAPTFTTTDLAAGLIPGSPGRAAADAKIVDFTNAYLWTTYCSPIGTPPPADDPQPPPSDFPTNPFPEAPDHKELRQMYLWIRWIARNMLPRAFQTGDPIPAQGNGFFSIPGIEMDDWPVQCMGVVVDVQLKPDYAGRSNGGDFPVFYDLGWFSLSTDGSAESPVRLQHTSQINMASLPRVNGLYHNLPPGVEVEFTPIYPDSPGMGGGG